MGEVCNIVVICITVVVSFLGFQSREIEDRYIFCPERILAWKEYYRLVTSGFLHAGWGHLFWNMFSLYAFGPAIEAWYGKADFLLIYFGSILGGGLLSLYVHRHHDYLAYGASGGVCGIIFAHILLIPGSGVNMFLLPVSVPGWLYAIGFLAISFFGMKSGRGCVGHDAHLGGAIIGLFIAAALQPEIAKYNWRIFAIVFLAATALLVYLWVNPMFLSVAAFAGTGSLWKTRRRQSEKVIYLNEQVEMDALLDRIQQVGMDGLTTKEKARLAQLSQRLKSRGESKGRETDLII